MNRVRHRHLVALLLTLLGLSLTGGTSSNVTAQPTLPFISYIPQSLGVQVQRSIFGTAMTAALPTRNVNGVRAMGATFVRSSALIWKDIEATEGGGYNWAAPSAQALEAELTNVSALGLEHILIVRGHPRWASTSDCSPINPAKYAQFAAFLSAAVSRYSQPPYNVRYWEIGNEPDAPQTGDNVFGCWGQPSDPFFGGGAYGNMLKTVYPAIKAANPQVNVLSGALLLDKPNVPLAKFMEGILRAGAGNSFDILAFHSYCYYQNNGNADGIDNRTQPCTNDWKVAFLRDLTGRFGVPTKPLMNTEAALLCTSSPTPDCRQAQADFIGRNFARAIRDGLIGNIWYIYDSDSFRSTSLVDPANPTVQRPGYAAFKQASLMLGQAKYLGALSGQPGGVEGHRFDRGGETATIVWSNPSRTIKVPVTGSVVTCYGRDGQALSCTASGGGVSITVGRSPVYIVSR